MTLVDQIQWDKVKGLLPVIVQSSQTLEVLMLGYMTPEALKLSIERKRVVFWSRTKERLWEKGESSGNTLLINQMQLDCDQDALVIQATPKGPTCHLGSTSCFQAGQKFPEMNKSSTNSPYPAIADLEECIRKRQIQSDQGAVSEASYTQQLLSSGIQRMAQKVGEEGVEVALAAVAQSKQALTSEAADLIYHLLVLLSAKHLNLSDIDAVLAERARAKT